MQRLATGRLVALAPEGGELWLDGGHNADAGRIVAAALADLEERVSRPLVLVVGMLATKDAEGFLRNFVGLARRLIAVPIHQDKTAPAESLAAVARAIGIPRGRERWPCAGDRRHPHVRPCARPAHSDHRLALSRGRSARRQRHVAGVIALRPNGGLPRTILPSAARRRHGADRYCGQNLDELSLIRDNAR